MAGCTGRGREREIEKVTTCTWLTGQGRIAEVTIAMWDANQEEYTHVKSIDEYIYWKCCSS